MTLHFDLPRLHVRLGPLHGLTQGACSRVGVVEIRHHHGGRGSPQGVTPRLLGGRERHLRGGQRGPAIAAAEIVAAALGHGRERIPRSVVRWLDANPSVITKGDGELARRAVERVVGEGSELRALWDDAGLDSDWHADVRILLTRLGGDPSQLMAESSGADDPAGQTEDQLRLAVLMFLRIRGLQPTAAQVARIEGSTDLDELRRWADRAANVASVEVMFE